MKLHSRIFQLESICEDLDLNVEVISVDADTFIEKTSFLDSIADYVVDSKNLSNDFECFISFLEKKEFIDYNMNNKTITFKKGFKENYFKERFNKFKEEVSKLTFKGFTDLWNSEMYKIKTLYKDKNSFYIITDCTENMDLSYSTLDDFIRTLNNDEDATFAFIKSLDYHF